MNNLYVNRVKKNKLLSAYQSGFRSNDSHVNQLLSIIHNLYKGFYDYPTLHIRGFVIRFSLKVS